LRHFLVHSLQGFHVYHRTAVGAGHFLRPRVEPDRQVI
jgi:hypothetical protein